MGYRSKVVFVVPESAPRFEEIENCFDTVKSREGFRLYVAEWLKWYDDYPIVQAVESYIAENSEQSLFMRVGESLGDTSELGDCVDNPFNLSLVQDIAYEE